MAIEAPKIDQEHRHCHDPCDQQQQQYQNIYAKIDDESQLNVHKQKQQTQQKYVYE